ncbi:MAG: 30S ribosomal protein S17 [Planctomycetota bacterium]
MTDSAGKRIRQHKIAPVRGNRKNIDAVVTSTKMQKTIVVETSHRVKHPKYKKFLSRSTKYYVHDEKNEARVGDIVRISETKPLSKLKRWRLIEILKRAPQIDALLGDVAVAAQTTDAESKGEQS